MVSNYEHIVYTYLEANLLKAALNHTVYEAPQVVLEKFNILNALPYYYIQWLLEINPAIVLDVGCGTNPFKGLIPNIIALDDQSCPPPYSNDALKCHFDKDFAESHPHMCDALISINAIHFSPIWTIKSRMLSMAQLVRPGGRAFVSFNAETWLMSTPKNQLQEYFGNYPTVDSVIEYMHQSVTETNLKMLVSDWPVCKVPEHSPIRDDLNGNIRLVFEVDTQIL
jgi:hypothetical protein